MLILPAPRRIAVQLLHCIWVCPTYDWIGSIKLASSACVRKAISNASYTTRYIRGRGSYTPYPDRISEMATMQAFVGRTHRIEFSAPYNRQSDFADALLCLSCRPPLFMRTRVTQPSSHCTQRSSRRPKGDFARMNSHTSLCSIARRSDLRVLQKSKCIPCAGGENLHSLDPSSDGTPLLVSLHFCLVRDVNLLYTRRNPQHSLLASHHTIGCTLQDQWRILAWHVSCWFRVTRSTMYHTYRTLHNPLLGVYNNEVTFRLPL